MLASITVDGLAGHHSSFCRMRGGGDDSNPPTVTPPTSVVQPLPLPGLYAVACSYIQQNFGSLTSDEVKRYWEGDGGLYVTALLVDRANTLIATVTSPRDEDLFGSFAGQKNNLWLSYAAPRRAATLTLTILCRPAVKTIYTHDRHGHCAPHLMTNISLTYNFIAA